MAKINPKYENPIDNFIVYETCSPISEYLHENNITPNTQLPNFTKKNSPLLNFKP